jgi:hypothetical protein
LAADFLDFGFTPLEGTAAALASVSASEAAAVSEGACTLTEDGRGLDLRGAGFFAAAFLAGEADFLGGAAGSGTTVSGVLSVDAGGNALFLFMAWLSGLRSGF